MTPLASTEAGPKNPYRGPREFRRGDRLPNRQQEARELTDRIVAERVVLLHAPSGAGKTSLIEAAVVDELLDEGFWATPRLRVNQPLPETRAVRNQYIYSLVTYLLSGPDDAEPSEDLSLREAVTRWRALAQPNNMTTVLIIDQLEEVLTLVPTDWGAKEAFFRELGMLLSIEPIWALLSMREDYMGGLDRYLRFLPGCLRSRYRLDFLSKDDARLAMRVPAEKQGVNFTTDAVDALADRLAVAKIQRPGEEMKTVSAPYIEPVQLQVVCRQLWKSIRKDRGDYFPSIEVADVEKHADIDKALTLYFGDTVRNAVIETGADELAIRDWFEFELITKQHFRGQTLRAPDTTKPQEVVRQLEDGYLIRGDVRGSSTWYELAHDRLVGPVLTSNETWRQANLERWQAKAYEWNDHDRHPAFLLQATEFPPAYLRKEMPDSSLTDVERAFLKASVNNARQNGILARTRSTMSLLAWAVIAEAIVIVALVIGLNVK
jgi:hypothetical protein